MRTFAPTEVAGTRALATGDTKGMGEAIGRAHRPVVMR
jgi:hypothetical protein